MATQKTQLSIKEFLPAPSVSRAPAWAVDSGGGSTLSFAEALFQRSSLRFHCNTAAFRIHAAAIAGDSDQDENVEFAFANRGSSLNAETAAGRRRERPAPAEEGTSGGGNEENVEEAFVAENDRERLKRRAERNVMQRVDGVARSAAARFASDGVAKQLTCSSDGDSTLIMSVAPESIRLFRLDTSCGELESPVSECVPFHGKRWGLGCLSASSRMMAMNSRSSVGIHVASVEAFVSRAFYRQEQDRDGALLAQQLHHHHHRVDDNDSEAASPGGEEHFPSFFAASERHASKRQNALTSIMWAGARDPHLVAASTSLTRAVLVWDLRANGKRGPVSEWSSCLPVAAAAAAPLAMQQPMGVASFAADSDGSYPVAMCTAAVAGGGAAPTAFVCVDSAFRVRMWDLRIATTSSSSSSSSGSNRTAISLTPSLVGRPDAPSLLEALRPALRSSIAEGDTAAIGSCSSVAADPLQPRSVWLNSSGGFVGRVDLTQHCSAQSGASGAGSSAALSHALYEDESVRDAHTATLPAPRLAVLGTTGGESASCTDALVACPRFSTRSVCVMVATDMLVDNGEAYAPGQQQPGQIRRRSAFARSIKPRRQRQFLLPQQQQQQQQQPRDESALVPVHCALVGRGIDEALVVEDQHRQLWYKRLAL